MCEEFVSDRLKSPSTAEFPGADSIEPLGNYVCTVRDNSDGNWTLVNLTMDE